MDDCHIIGSAAKAQTHTHDLATVVVQSIIVRWVVMR